MKSTGVIRRIDELGRIVIPKEIRRHLGIREGENLEIYTDDDNRIVLKKYSRMLEYTDFSSKLCELVPLSMNFGMIITDRDKVVSVSNRIEFDPELCDIPSNLLEYIQNRETYESSVKEKMLISNQEVEGYFYVQPIISSIDCLGLIIFVKDQAYHLEEKQFAKFLSTMIANKIDIS